MALLQLVFLSHAQAFQVGQLGQEPERQLGQESLPESGCANVRTLLDHTGFRWKEEWSECSATCGGGVQRNKATCLDDSDQEVSWHLCPGDKPAGEKACGTAVCFCDLTQQAAYWLLPEKKRLEVGQEEVFECDDIPHYYIKGQKLLFRCTEDGLVQESECPCLTVGRLKQKFEVNFGPLTNNEWLEVSDNGWLQKENPTDPDIKKYSATVLGSTSDLKFEFRKMVTSGKEKDDSIIYGVTPEECMRICLYHNQWAQNYDQKGCSVAVPRALEQSQADSGYFPDTFLSDSSDNTCWLRHTKSEELTKITIDQTKSPYSYDMKCMVDMLEEQEDKSDVPTWLQSPVVTPVYSQKR